MSTTINFGGSIPQHYQDYLTNFLFEGFAEDLVSRVQLPPHAWVLELACGTGCVTRRLAALVPRNAQLIASDLQAGMLAVAKEALPRPDVNWAVVDMMTIPYEDGLFDVIVCQFGIMLVPDRARALCEIYRVLKPGGRLVFNVWSNIQRNGVWFTTARVLEAFLPENPLLQDPGPFAMEMVETLSLLENTGFSGISCDVVRQTGEIDSAAHAAKGMIQGLPVALAIEQHNPAQLAGIQHTLCTELGQTWGNAPLRSPLEALVFEAHK